MVRANGAVSLRELARVVQTSEVTVRRDVRALEAEGLLDRRHGGAVLPGGFTRESGFPQKSHLATAEKTAIADLAASFVEEGEAIVVGAGTTTQELARRLARVPGLTVVTNSLLVAQALAHANRVEVVMTGGTLRGSNYALVGSGAEQSLQGLRVSRAFLSGSGLTAERGLSTSNMLSASVDRALVQGRGGGGRPRRPHQARNGHHVPDGADGPDHTSGDGRTSRARRPGRYGVAGAGRPGRTDRRSRGSGK
ncbi:DeoR/GlpR family transcriptional regulator of sugar metabolism [Streptomyces calvus]